MKASRLVAAMLAVSILGACAGPPPSKRPPVFGASHAKIVAADSAANRMDREKGQLASAREFAAPDAVIFQPNPVNARQHYEAVMASEELNKDEPLTRYPREIILSCDGKTGVITVDWVAADGSSGYYTAVWQYYQRRDSSEGKWMWTLWHGQTSETARKPAEMASSRTASCEGRAPASISVPAEGEQMKQMLSIDQTLSYSWRYREGGPRVVEVKLWDGQQMVSVLRDEVAAE